MDWKTDIKSWTKIAEPTASLMLNQCDEALKDTTDTARSISARADMLLSIILPIMSALIIYIVNDVGINNQNVFKLWPLSSAIGIFFLVLSGFFCIRNIMKYTLYSSGEYPKDLVVSTYIDTNHTGQEQYINMIIGICEKIQSKIDANNITNSRRTSNNVWCLRILCCLPICPFLAWSLNYLSTEVNHWHCFSLAL